VDAFDAAALGLPLIQLSVVTVNVHESRNAFPINFDTLTKILFSTKSE
jgi:hypothetical protein